MGELSELTGAMRALKNVKEAELIGMPKLKKCVLMGGLKSVKSVKMENVGKLESVKGLKEVMEAERKRGEEEERKKREEEERKKEEEEKQREEMMALAKTTVSVKCVGDLKNANCYIGVIVIASSCCNDSELSVLDMSRFVNLRELNVGGKCFEYVNEVKLIGLNHLERVVIGKNSFTKEKNWPGNDPDGHFYLKNCERVRELKMGCYSFYDYCVCEIENVPSLEVIEMGDLIEVSNNYCCASLELKSDSERMK